MSEANKPVDLVMLHPDGKTEIEIAADIVEDCKARGFKEVCTVEEARKKAAAAKKPAAEK